MQRAGRLLRRAVGRVAPPVPSAPITSPPEFVAIVPGVAAVSYGVVAGLMYAMQRCAGNARPHLCVYVYLEHSSPSGAQHSAVDVRAVHYFSGVVWRRAVPVRAYFAA